MIVLTLLVLSVPVVFSVVVTAVVLYSVFESMFNDEDDTDGK